MAAALDAVVVSELPLWRYPWFAYCVEFERVLADLLEADVVEVTRRDGRVAQALQHRGRLRNRLASVPPLRVYDWTATDHRYDLAVVVVSDLGQLSLLAAIPNWRSLADRFVAYVWESWSSTLPGAGQALADVVDHLDHLFVGIESVVPDLRRTTTTPVDFVAPAVDVLQVNAPLPVEQRRIDVSNRGRRDAAQHALLQQWAADTGGYYEFDTAALAGVDDPGIHRRHYYEQTARSRAFVANVARFDQLDLRGSAREFGLRYFEALACGTLVLGDHPPADAVERLLGDVPGLLDLPVGSTVLPPAVADVLADDAAVVSLGAANRRAALDRHDVLHRWQTMAGVLGIADTPGVVARRAALAAERARLG